MSENLEDQITREEMAQRVAEYFQYDLKNIEDLTDDILANWFEQIKRGRKQNLVSTVDLSHQLQNYLNLDPTEES